MEQNIAQGGENGGDKNKKPQLPPPQQLQQCPRCDSMNTKFCYYNNYSLAQPRFFCKTCKRYWTQGGTLRNIPIGGSPRKGRRNRNASSSQPQPSPHPQPRIMTHEVVQFPNQPNLTTFMRPIPPTVVQPPGPYYQGGGGGSGGGGGGGGGYVTSLAAAPPMNPIPPPLDQSLNVIASPNSGIQPYYRGQIHPQGFYPEPRFSFPSNMANHRAPDTSLWNNAVNTISSISGNTQNNARGGGSSSFIPKNYPNLPGNGPHYQ